MSIWTPTASRPTSPTSTRRNLPGCSVLALRTSLLLLALSPAAASAAVIPVDWIAVDAAVLDEARGGFTLPSGLAVAIGIERTVAVNGEIVARTRFEIPDLRLMTPEQALQTREAMSSIVLVQNGIHGGETVGPDGLDMAVVADLLRQEGLHADWAMADMIW